eukprot:GHVU01209783.1.p1 GENE.GHVU01209783.1~~GHVU01209783.1.p1  ORF type:complete len:177 (+),score=14.47 GHVU01209783.1:61-591(+)
MSQGSYVDLPKAVIGKKIDRVYQVKLERHEGKDDFDWYATVKLHFWRTTMLEEKPHEVTLKMERPNKDKLFDEKGVLEELKTQVPELGSDWQGWRVFISTTPRYDANLTLMNPSDTEYVFKYLDQMNQLDISKDTEYHLLLLAGTVSRSWKPEARAGRSRTGTCLCPNLPWPRRWY